MGQGPSWFSRVLHRHQNSASFWWESLVVARLTKMIGFLRASRSVVQLKVKVGQPRKFLAVAVIGGACSVSAESSSNGSFQSNQKEVTISFVGKVEEGLDCDYEPTADFMEIQPDQTGLVFFRCTNNSENSIQGIFPHLSVP